MKVIQLEKARFIKLNELSWIQVELFSFFHFMCAADNASELFCMAYLANDERFLYHSNFSFYVLIFYVHLNSPAWVDENQLMCEMMLLLSEMSKTHFLAFELIFISSTWWVYLYIKFNISIERLEWDKKCSIFAK